MPDNRQNAPLDTPSADAIARNRFFVISFARLIGAALVVVGLLSMTEVISGIPTMLGLPLTVVGLAAMIAIPQMLARQWRTPPPPANTPRAPDQPDS